jgi:hypothetical protein
VFALHSHRGFIESNGVEFDVIGAPVTEALVNTPEGRAVTAAGPFTALSKGKALMVKLNKVWYVDIIKNVEKHRPALLVLNTMLATMSRLIVGRLMKVFSFFCFCILLFLTSCLMNNQSANKASVRCSSHSASDAFKGACPADRGTGLLDAHGFPKQDCLECRNFNGRIDAHRH